MKKCKGLLIGAISMACAMMFASCTGKESENDTVATSVIYDYNWQASQDESLMVCEEDGSFKYYQSADDMTDNYYEGTYEFYVGDNAVDYITSELSDYGLTEDELEEIFKRNDEYNEENFVCLVLNNESCIIDGENQIQSSYKTPYYGFYLEENGKTYLDIANMNTGNYVTYIAK